MKADKKVLASGGRGITPGSGSSTDSNSLMKSRSRMNIIEKAGRTTIEKAGRTTPLGNGPTLEVIQEKKKEERRMRGSLGPKSLKLQ